MLSLGLRAHDYGRLPPEQLADVLAAFQPDSIQLALSKAFPGPYLPGSLSPGYARRIRNIFEKRDISIAVLGCYINPVHPDPTVREGMLRSFEEHLRYARDFGCPLVGTETGSCKADGSYHPDTARPETFDLLCGSVERLVRTAETCGSIVAVEGVADQHTLSSIALLDRLLRRLASPALKVIYDPVNLIPAAGLAENQETFFTRAFDCFGEHIAAIHVKDFHIQGGKKTGDLPAGTGDLDYPALLKILLERKPGIDLLLENAKPQNVRKAMAFLRKTADALRYCES